MRTEKTRAALSLLLALLCLLPAGLCAVAADGSENTGDLRYTNPQTAFTVMIIDELDLLTDTEERALVEDMAPITEFGHAVFWTTKEYAANEMEQARLKRRALHDLDSACIFAINMEIRKITVQSYGRIYTTITDSRARSITDNASHYASQERYYDCAKRCYEQIFTLLEGNRIAEPMRYVSIAAVSLMLGLIVMSFYAFSLNNPMIKKPSDAPPARASGTLNTVPPKIEYVTTLSIYSPQSSGSDSSCGGGSSCCGGGSSCGGGGSSCGGGGSSSF